MPFRKRRPQRFVRTRLLPLFVIIFPLQMSLVNVQLTTANSDSLINHVSGLTVYDLTQDGVDDVLVTKYLETNGGRGTVTEYYSRLLLIDGATGQTLQVYGAAGLGKEVIKQVVPLTYGSEQKSGLLVVDYGLWLVDGQDLNGIPIWDLQLSLSGIEIGDLFGNGSQIAIGWGGSLHAIDPESGTILWSLNEVLSNCSQNNFGKVCIAQLDDDSPAELVTTIFGGGPKSYVLALDGDNGHIRWIKERAEEPSYEKDGVFFTYDLNQDTVEDIILVYDYGYGFSAQELIALDGRNGDLLWNTSGVYTKGWMDSTCLQDFNGDEIADLILWEQLPEIQARPALYNLSTGTMVWSTPSIYTYCHIGVTSATKSAPQVIAITNSAIVGLSGVTGELQWTGPSLWSDSTLFGTRKYSLLASGNFTGDKSLDVVVGHYHKGEVWMLDGITHEVLWHLPLVTTRLSTTKTAPIKFTTYVIVVLACIWVAKRNNRRIIQIY